MKRILEGLRYDTDTATLVGKADATPTAYHGDFAYWTAGLYKTRRGRFFLAGSGGPMTRFAERIASGMQGGSKIIPLDMAEAREWAERYLSTDEVERAFAAAVEDA